MHLPELGRAASELARVVRSGGRVMVSDVHPFLIMLGWQAQFRTAGDEAAFMRLNHYMFSDYCRAFIGAGFSFRGCHEPCLTAQSAVTPTAERLPEANCAAWAGLPGVVIWDLQKG